MSGYNANSQNPASMNATNIVWNNEDFEEYCRQLQLLQDSYGDAIPVELLRRRAADIVNKQKQL